MIVTVKLTGTSSTGFVVDVEMAISGCEPTVTFTVAAVAPPAVAVTVASRVAESRTLATPFEPVVRALLDRLPVSVLKDTGTPLRGVAAGVGDLAR